MAERSREGKDSSSQPGLVSHAKNFCPGAMGEPWGNIAGERYHYILEREARTGMLVEPLSLVSLWPVPGPRLFQIFLACWTEHYSPLHLQPCSPTLQSHAILTVSQFFCCCDKNKIPKRNNLKEERIILTLGERQILLRGNLTQLPWGLWWASWHGEGAS